MKEITRRRLLLLALTASAMLAVLGLLPRIEDEKSNRNVAFVVEYKDLLSLALQNEMKPSSVWQKIHALGVIGLSVQEYTGEELTFGSPLPLRYGSAEALGIKIGGIATDNAAILIDRKSRYFEPISSYIRIKMPKTRIYKTKNNYAIILPGDMREFKFSSIVPDFPALEFCMKNGIPILFRPGPCTPAGGRDVAESLHFLASRYGQIKNIIPSGLIVPGYPDVASLADVLKRDHISLSEVEFVKQIGDTSLAVKVAPDVIPLHSLTRDEIISKNTSRRQMEERFVRAVHERSIRLIMMHPYDLQMGNRLDVFMEDLGAAKAALEARGYRFAWPDTMKNRTAPMTGAFACAISLIFCFWFYCARIRGAEDGQATIKEALYLIAMSCVLSMVVWKIPQAARMMGGFCGAFAAAEAALTALERHDKPVFGAIGGLFAVAAGGLSIASFYGTTFAALRLTPFSGVKLTLLLPPLLLLAHDLKRRVHPESVSEIVTRPAVWGELMLVGLVMAALAVMALRSDNVSNVPAWEIAFRDFVERMLVVRPRTKEFLIGYPALVIYWYMVRRGLAIHYREVLRLAASLAFCSAVNTFCHFHTMLWLSLVRVFNGWWLGLLLGFVFAAVISFFFNTIKKQGEMLGAR